MSTSLQPVTRFPDPLDFFRSAFSAFDPFWKTDHAVAPTLPVDVTREKDVTVVTADLPGYEQGDVDVTVDGSTLTIKATKRDDHTEKRGDVVLSERRSYSEVSRTLDFETPIDASKVSARMEKGVLTVRLPEESASSAKRVAIESK